MPDGIPTWEEIAREHGRFLYTVAYRLAGSDADAQDLVQEALLRVRRGLETYTPGSLEAWLARIVTNVFLDEVRRRRRRPSTAFPEQPDLVLPPTVAADEASEALSDEVQARARGAAGGVPHRGRAVRCRRLVVRRDRRRPGHPGRHRALAHPPRPPPAADGAVVSSQFDSGLPEDLISAYLDGECSEAERAAVAARLESDPEWQAVFAEVSAARDAVRALPPVEPPAGFIESLIDADAPNRARAHRSRRARTFAGLAAVAAIVAGFVLASPKHDNTRVAPPIATLADSHGATVSLQSDPVSGLAPIAATPGSTEPRP